MARRSLFGVRRPAEKAFQILPIDESDPTETAIFRAEVACRDCPFVSLCMKTFLLYVTTAIAEIVGCYLPYLWLKEGKSAFLLIPAALSLALFAWLLTLHPAAAGRVYAAYGGVYVSVALVWLWWVQGIALTRWDLAGVALALMGMALIAFQPR